MDKRLINYLFGHIWAFLYNMLLIYIAFTLCRVVFLWTNQSYFPSLNFTQLISIFKGGLIFDTSAIIYLNILYIFLFLFPIHFKETKVYYQICKWIYLITNSIGIIVNLMDTVYFQYTNRRTTATVFSEFTNESNLSKIIGIEMVNHWYLTLLGIACIFLLYKLYKNPPNQKNKPLGLYYLVNTVSFVLVIPFCIFGIRGGIGAAVRPITLSNANQYVNRPIETSIVLNTPFSIIRTIGKKAFITPDYFKTPQERHEFYSAIHLPKDSAEFRPLNVVVLIMESFGKEYIGALNKTLDEGNNEGYTPFLDSLITHSLTYTWSFSNGKKSIDGMPSVLSGIPMFIEPFFLTSASLNKVSGLGRELLEKGYYTAFFHGAKNGSMGFEAYARASGYTDYFGRSEYNNDRDFDGRWAIWDEEFLQFFADKLSEFKQPFSTAFFSATSHHPFVIPERYKDVFPEGELPIHKCVRYTDYSLKRFFEKASQQPWFENTVFVITADHTNQSMFPQYQTESGIFSVPVIFYHSGSGLKGIDEKAIAQQIDIMPTVLSYLGYDVPFISFGCDLLTTPAEETFAVNYLNGIYQYYKQNYLLQFDGKETIAIYDFKQDILLERNLLGQVSEQYEMELELKAIIEEYMDRMNTDQLTVE